MAIQWKKIPLRRGRQEKATADFKRIVVRLPPTLHAAVEAVAAQLRKDRKHLKLQTFERPVWPSVNSVTIKALEMLLWHEKGKHGKSKKTD